MPHSLLTIYKAVFWVEFFAKFFLFITKVVWNTAHIQSQTRMHSKVSKKGKNKNTYISSFTTTHFQVTVFFNIVKPETEMKWVTQYTFLNAYLNLLFQNILKESNYKKMKQGCIMLTFNDNFSTNFPKGHNSIFKFT